MTRRCWLLLSLLCAGSAALAADARSEWNLWFAEYDEISPLDGRPVSAIFVFVNRFVPSLKGTPIRSVELSDTGGSFDIYEQNGAHFADRLPLFAPTPTKTTLIGGQFDCEAAKERKGYAVTCRSVYGGGIVRSFYEPAVGVKWFEYFCGVPRRVCRYQLTKGKGLMRRELIASLRKSGAIMKGAPVRPKPGI